MADVTPPGREAGSAAEAAACDGQRIPLADFRDLLPPKYREMPDEAILALRERLYDLAGLIIQAVPEREE